MPNSRVIFVETRGKKVELVECEVPAAEAAIVRVRTDALIDWWVTRRHVHGSLDLGALVRAAYIQGALDVHEGLQP